VLYSLDYGTAEHESPSQGTFGTASLTARSDTQNSQPHNEQIRDDLEHQASLLDRP